MGKLSAEGLLQADDAKPEVVVVGSEIQRKQMQVKTLQQSHEILPSFFPLFQQKNEGDLPSSPAKNRQAVGG